MPIYEFICRKCGHKFSTLCKVHEEVPCPQCGGETKKLFSTFAISTNSPSEESTSPSCSTCSLPSCDTCKL